MSEQPALTIIPGDDDTDDGRVYADGVLHTIFHNMRHKLEVIREEQNVVLRQLTTAHAQAEKFAIPFPADLLEALKALAAHKDGFE